MFRRFSKAEKAASGAEKRGIQAVFRAGAPIFQVKKATSRGVSKYKNSGLRGGEIAASAYVRDRGETNFRDCAVGET